MPHDLRLDTGSEEGLHLRRDLLDQIEDVRFVIDELSMNGRVFRDIRGVEFSPWGITVRADSELPESSVLGLGFFKRQRILIDYLSKELTVFDATSDFDPDRDTGWIEVPFRHSAEGLVLVAMIAGRPHDMVLDTGATISFAVANRIADTIAAVPCQSIYASLSQEGCRLIPVDVEFGAASLHAFLIEDDPGNFEATGLFSEATFSSTTQCLSISAGSGCTCGQNRASTTRRPVAEILNFARKSPAIRGLHVARASVEVDGSPPEEAAEPARIWPYSALS